MIFYYFWYFGPAQQCDFVFSLFAKNAFTPNICTLKVIIIEKIMILVTIVTRVFTFSKIEDFFTTPYPPRKTHTKTWIFYSVSLFFRFSSVVRCENGFHDSKKTKPP